MRATFLGILSTLLLTGCAANYVTPGAGVSQELLSKSDTDVAEILKREPTATFPARIALARVESRGYRTRGSECFGNGRMCLVTAHEVESDQDFERLGSLPLVSGLAPLGRMLIPEQLNSVKDLRLAAATLRADLLLVYSIDTRFHVATQEIGPFALISLGMLPNKRAHVTTTASAALIDVRTGFVYGVADATAVEEQQGNIWHTEEAVDAARLRAEGEAFKGMVGQCEKLWGGIVQQYISVR